MSMQTQTRSRYSIPSVFLGRLAFRYYKPLESRGEVLSKEDLLLVEDQVREHFNVVELDVSESIGPYRLHPWVLRKLTYAVVRSLNWLWKKEMETGEGSRYWVKYKCHSYLLEGQGTGSEVNQLHLNSWEADGVTNPGDGFHTHKGEEEDPK